MRRILCVSVILIAGPLAIADDKKPEPKGEEVSGKINLDGKPLPAGMVTFATKDGKVTITTLIAQDGTYKATVPIGVYVVAVGNVVPKKDPKDPKDAPKPIPLIPAKYGDVKTSPLICTVVKGKNAFDIELKSK